MAYELVLILHKSHNLIRNVLNIINFKHLVLK